MLYCFLSYVYIVISCIFIHENKQKNKYNSEHINNYIKCEWMRI